MSLENLNGAFGILDNNFYDERYFVVGVLFKTIH